MIRQSPTQTLCPCAAPRLQPQRDAAADRACAGQHRSASLRTWAAAVAGIGAALLAADAQAQPAAPASAASAVPITYPTVAKALSALEAKDGTDTIVVHTDGWVIINEPAAKAQWSFTPAGHAAYPAVVRRIIRRAPDRSVSVETTSLCEAPAAACTDLLAEFAKMDQRVTEAVRGRGQAPVPPPQ